MIRLQNKATQHGLMVAVQIGNRILLHWCRGADVYILADNDEAGKRVAETIQNDIKTVAKSSKIIVPMPDTPKADITDFFSAGHSKQEFEQMLQQEQSTVKEAVREEVAKHDTTIKTQEQQDSCLEQVLKDLHAERYETSDKGLTSKHYI